MNKPITTRINQSSSLGMKVREPFLNVGEVKSPGKQSTEPKIEQSEGYVLNQDGTVGYGGTTKTITPGENKTITTGGGSGTTEGLPNKTPGTTFKNPAVPGQSWSEFVKAPCGSPGKPFGRGMCKDVTPEKTEIVQGDPVVKEVDYMGNLKKKVIGTQDAPWVSRMQIRGDKIAKNKAQKQKIKTARQAGEFKGQGRVSQFMDALGAKKEANKEARGQKRAARQAKRDAMKKLRKGGQEGIDALNKGIDALTGKPGTSNITKKQLKKQIKQNKQDAMKDPQKVIDANRKTFNKAVGNIEGNKVKKAIKNEYNKKLSTALDARLDNRIAGAQQGVKIGGNVDLGGKNLTMDDLSLPNQINVITGKPISGAKKIKTVAYKMHPKSPITKALVGNQHRLPQHLQDAIKAAPGKAYKKY